MTHDPTALKVLSALEEYSGLDYDHEYRCYVEALNLRVLGLKIEHVDDLQLVESIASKLGETVTTFLKKIADEAKLSFADVVVALKTKTAFGLLKAIGYSIKGAWDMVNKAMDAYSDGLLSVFEKLEKTKAIQKANGNVEQVDEILEQYPVCKRVTGVVLAGVILLGWTQMTFLGALKYDFDFSKLGLAIAGKYSLAEFLTSKHGLMYLTLVGTGAVLGISAPWLGSTLYNFVLGLLYTTALASGKAQIAVKLKGLISRIKGGGANGHSNAST